MDVLHLLTAPPVIFSLAIGLFLALVRSPWPWTRAGGTVLAALLLAGLILALREPGPRGSVLSSERLPILILALASAGAVWVAFYQALHASAGPDEPAHVWYRTSSAELAAGGAVVVAVAAGAYFVGTPLGPIADPSGARDDLAAPWFMLGLQEIRPYFDAWVPTVLLPLLTIVGLLILPYLDVPGDQRHDDFDERRDVVYFFLFVWFLLGLLPMAAVVLDPSEAGKPAELAAGPGAARPLSYLVWGWFLEEPPRPPWLRELPALLALGVYFFALPRWLPRWKPTRAVFGRYLKQLGARRFLVAMALMQLWMLVPLKMYGRWLLDVGYFLYLPELAFRF